MKVHLAGFNVDTTVLHELQDKSGQRQDVTPEVISAAYARISRDPRPIEDIRKDARDEVERARKSNSTIIFKMGHHSVAEHAVFNLDIVGASRLAMEEIEKFRLCSYTEKSQRYITLDKDYALPEEIQGTRFEKPFIEMIEEQNQAYLTLFEKLKAYTFEKFASLAGDSKNHNLLEGWAKEDARYITALATQSQVGLTVNARNGELMLRRFASHPLSEVRQLGQKIYEALVEVAPSIVLFHEANDRDTKTYPELKDFIQKAIGPDKEFTPGPFKEVELVDYTPNGDEIIAAALLHSSTQQPFDKCRELVKALPADQLKGLFKTAFKNMQFYDSQLREFEYAHFTFNIILSAACFGQLKRHRMATLTAQPYDPRLGCTVPAAIKEIAMEKFFEEIVEKTNRVYEEIHKELPLAAPYILTNAHRRRALLRVNARELYHISRLREDAHAQWDIREISRAMAQAVQEIMPLACALIGGKDSYNDVYQRLFGHPPKVTEAVLPGARKIK